MIVCLDRPDSVILWSTSLDERAFQTNARLLDISELGETMLFLAGRLTEGDFTLTKHAGSINSDVPDETSQVNVTLTHSKNKQSITLHLREHADEGEKASLLSKILLNVYKRNEQLSAELNAQRAQSRSNAAAAAGNVTERKSSDSKSHLAKGQERHQMSLINPTVKRRKAATGVNYGEDNDSD